MGPNSKNLLTFLVSILTMTLLSPAISLAQTVTVTNAYICAPKNIGGESTRLFFRQQDGTARNISKTEIFPVVCPIVVPAFRSSYEVIIRVGNRSLVEQEFSCAVEEWTKDFTKVRQWGQSIYLQAERSNDLYWENLTISAPSNALSLRCILPPGGGIALIGYGAS